MRSYLKRRRGCCRQPWKTTTTTTTAAAPSMMKTSPSRPPSSLWVVLMVVFMTSTRTTPVVAFTVWAPSNRLMLTTSTTLNWKNRQHQSYPKHVSWSTLLQVSDSAAVEGITATSRRPNIEKDDELWYYANGIVPKTKPLPESVGYYAKFVAESFQQNWMAKKRRKQEEMQRKMNHLLEGQQQHQQRRRSFWGLSRFLPWNRKLQSNMQNLARDGLQEEKKNFSTAAGTVFEASNAQKLKSSSATWREAFCTLDDQRRNLVALAGYNTAIVMPSFVFLILGSLMNSIIPHYYSKCLQCVATLEPSQPKLLRALIGLAITSTLGAIFTGLRGCLFWIAGSRANYNVRVKLHRNLLLQEAAFFDRNEVGYLLSRLNNDVNKIGMVISFHVNVVLRQLAQFIFGSIFLIRISPRLSFWAFAGIGLVAWVSAVYGEFARGLAQTVQDTFAEGTAVAETSLTMSETIRAFDGVSIESKRYEQAQGHALELEEVQAWAYGSHKFISDSLQSTLQVALLFGCWVLGRAGGLPASQLTTFIFYANFVLESSNEVGDQWAKIQGAVGASSSVFDLIRRIPTVRDPVEKVLAKAAAEKAEQRAALLLNESVPKVHNPMATTTNNNNISNGAALVVPTNGVHQNTEPIIAIHNMTIQYEAMDSPAVSGVDLNIYPGDRVAIVGRSGSGKSSMLRSILRFYDPSSGCIQLDGQDLRNMSRLEIASKIAVVEQEPSLFPMSLLENVLYGIDRDTVDPTTGLPCYSEEYCQAVEESLRLAGLPVHAGNDLGLELDTRVGEGGRTLSGGQRQRVAIARALVREPEVLLLDEPTAALDSQSESKVVQALLAALEHAKSMIMVTHRLGVIRKLNVNRVVVMEKGRIVEAGHPEVLLRDPNGIYTSLAREQGVIPVINSATTNNDTLPSSMVHSYV